MGDTTINFWMILAVILLVGMIAILAYSIYRGFNNCHHRIDKQSDSLEKMDGRFDTINNEITNIKIDQAAVKAFQTLRVDENKGLANGGPINIYQQQSPPQQSPPPYEKPLGEPIQPSVNYSYEHQPQQVKQQEVPPPIEQEAPQIMEEEAPRPFQENFREEAPLQFERLQQPIQRQAQAETVIDLTQKPSQLDSPQVAQQPYKIAGESMAPVYHQTRIPGIGLTEFQIPEEYDIENELDYNQSIELKPQPVAETIPGPIGQQRTEIRPEQKPQQRSPLIPQKERGVPAKFNSLNDGISRTGKRYSEEELANRILD